MSRRTLVTLLFLSLAGISSPRAATAEPGSTVDDIQPASERSLAEVAKEVWNRDTLTGDWWGLRTDLAKHGINVGLTMSHFGQGVASGGVDKNAEYGGKMDYRVNVDMKKLVPPLWEGLVLSLHAESRWGKDILGDAGAFALPNAPLMYPLPGNFDGTRVTGLLAIQTLFDGKAQVLAGKVHSFDMITGLFPNVVDYGLEGFLNANSFLSVLPWGRWLTLSQWGTAGWTIKNGMASTGYIVVGQENTTDSWDIEGSFDDGVGIMAFHRFLYEIDDKMGYVYVGAGGSTEKYASTDSHDFTDVPGAGVGSTKKKRPWGVAVYLYQVFWQDADNDKRFAQFFVGGSLADDNPSFSRWDLFASVQAFGPLASRPNDRMGLAGWYNALADDFDDTVSSIPGLSLRDTWGFEVYYNIEINPWLHLTPDLQLVMNENNGDDLAVIPGIRAVIDF